MRLCCHFIDPQHLVHSNILVTAGGQLGLGDENDYWSPTKVSQLADGGSIHTNEDHSRISWRALDLSCGLNHTAALVEVLQPEQS